MAISNIKQTRTGRMQFQGLFECVAEAEALWNPASVGSNEAVSETMTVIGSRVGDMVLVSYDGDLQKLILNAYSSGVDEVTIQLHNSSAGAVDLAENNIHVIVLKPQHSHN